MRKTYDFSSMEARKNPYADKLNKEVTTRVGTDVIEYFEKLATEAGISHQALINLCLRECTFRKWRPRLDWITE